ncbi:MAG: hypothetical protein IJ520_02040 [Synergistaceae bacterium]|nr:hypothetical protein [Synergistaceae bacterium]
MFGGTAATVITASIIGGVLCAVVSGLITRSQLDELAKNVKEELKNKANRSTNVVKLDALDDFTELKIRANRSTNVVRLENRDAETVVEVRGDGIADDVRTGDLIYV